MNEDNIGSQVVIIKSFNDNEYIDECIVSVLSQENFKDLEVHIIDDCSNDGTQSKILKYKKYFKSIELRDKNYGAINNNHDYNKILNKYNGGYISIISGDDYWPAKKTALHQKVFSKYNIGLHFGLGKIVGTKKKLILPSRNTNKFNE